MKTTRFVLVAFVLLAALPAGATDHVSVGSFAAGEAYVPPPAHAPARVSRAYVRTVAAADGRTSVDLPVAGSARLLVWTVASGASVSASLRTPGGRALAAGESRSADGTLRRVAIDAAELGLDVPGEQEALEVRGAEPGRYGLDIESVGAAAVSVVVAEPESAVTLSAWAGPLSRPPHEPVVLGAELRDGQEPVAGRVIARLAGPDGKGGDPIALHDDGRHLDGEAGDGVYGARVETALAPGFWSVRFDASGEDARGGSFERTGSSGFMSESGAARLGATRARLGEGLHVDAVAEVTLPGRYRLDVIAATTPDPEGRQTGVAWAESPRTLGAGHTTLAVTLPAESLGDAANGPLFLDVRLVGLDAPGVSRTTLTVRAR